MPKYPKLGISRSFRELCDTFRGYNHRARIGASEFYDTQNLSCAEYPMLTARKKRGTVQTLSAPGGCLGKDALAFVDDGVLYYDGEATALDSLAPGEKQLVSMGAYIVIFPDKLYYNTADGNDHGSLEASYSSTGTVRCTLCRSDGSELTTPDIGAEPPDDPAAGTLWIDSSGEKPVLKQWSVDKAAWIENLTSCVRLRFASRGELGGLFSAHDGVTVAGAEEPILNGSKLIRSVGTGTDGYDYIVLDGLITGAVEQTTGSISITRTVPELDFVCECRNRLWGCRFGVEGERTVNEICCCALGDFKNWQQFEGLSTDSWVASVGSDGAWTGCVNYLGSPTFFKENSIHVVSVSAAGAHRINETACRGVQKGSDKSLAVLNEKLFYKSRGEICVYQGGFPSGVSAALGDELYSNACAGAVGDRYYIAMDDASHIRQLFVYDAARGIWMREDTLNAQSFARVGDELYCMTDRALIAVLGTEGEREPFVPWMAESGMLCYEYADKKYLSRLSLRLWMEEGAELEVYLQYDSGNLWERQGLITLRGTGTVNLPVCPHRCDHFRLRLVGKGEFRLYSIARILETGSDV